MDDKEILIEDILKEEENNNKNKFDKGVTLKSTEDRIKEISEAKGNYIFTIGNVDSGKTTLHKFLYYSLSISKYVDVSTKDNKEEDQRILDDWKIDFKRRVLPKERTLEGTLKEFSLHISERGSKNNLAFTFVEISGEDMTGLIPSSKPKSNKIHPILKAYLKNDDIEKKFIFISDGRIDGGMTTTRDSSKFLEDDLFQNFIEYCIYKNYVDMNHMEILFIVSKWDLIRDKYSDNHLEYFEENFANTKSLLEDYSLFGVAYTPFYIGEIKEYSKGEQKIDRILSFNFFYINYLTQWLYFSFTGKSLRGMPKIRKTFMEKWFGWLIFKKDDNDE